MKLDQLTKSILKSILSLLGIGAFLFFLIKINVVIVYIAISMVLALMLSPFTSLLKSKLKFNNLFASITSLFFLLIIMIVVIGAFIPLIIEQSKNLSLLNNSQLKSNIENLIINVSEYFSSNNLTIYDFLSEFTVLSDIDFAFIPKLLNYIISEVGSIGIGLLSILFITFFFIKDGDLILNKINNLLPQQIKNNFLDSVSKIKVLLSRYFIGISVQIFSLFVLYSIMLSIIGIKNALVIAFLCALLNIIPYIGPLISIVLMAILTMTNYIDSMLIKEMLSKVGYIFIGFSIVQLIDNFLIQPYIFSKSVKSHPLEVFIVIISSGILFGIIGLIIAIPLYTALKVIYFSYSGKEA
ncbi:MAG: AI-2E family transporter [Bacteroidota bacterium]|nr:AI-2E family transporter [Bacteroidota bacterium]|tara:strand:- start:386 stop:1447 length:1062 start_codon:yes stop_codon:yes gene_type:complete